MIQFSWSMAIGICLELGICDLEFRRALQEIYLGKGEMEHPML